MSIAARVAARFRAQGELWLDREEVAKVCPSCAEKMASLGIRKVRASALFSDERVMTAALQMTVHTVTGAKWETKPKGWTQESLKSYWESLTGAAKHKVTKCIEKMKGAEGVDDPGAFCAALADRMEPGWRSERGA